MPIFAARRVALALGYQPPVILDVCVMNETLHSVRNQWAHWRPKSPVDEIEGYCAEILRGSDLRRGRMLHGHLFPTPVAGFSFGRLVPHEEIDGRQHPCFDLQVVVLALPSYFFLMRFEIAHALSDFVAL